MKRFIVLALISVGAFQISYAQTWESGPGKVVLNPQNAKVGIGTSRPNSKLNINAARGQDALRVQVKGHTRLYLNSNGGMTVGNYIKPPSRGLYVYGNVGIGTSRPNSKLNINAARGQDALRVQVKGHTRLYLNSNGGMTVGNYIEPPSRGLYVYGNVGIGTTKPSQKLDVNGEGRFKGLRLPSGGKLRFGMESNNSWITIQNANDAYSSSMDIKGNFYFRNTNKGAGLATAHPMGIQRDGTVTMGVWETYDNSIRDTQGHRLMVNGGILCERVKVIADVPNSDHVFEKDYDLLPLSEVKQFILENKHLPEVPSAAEFKENGYNLGEMDDLLLRKVEELTLHMIRLEEEIKDLRGEE